MTGVRRSKVINGPVVIVIINMKYVEFVLGWRFKLFYSTIAVSNVYYYLLVGKIIQM